ncbi:hypothetical protein GR170_08995 [Pseudooceanicola sp. GBMRC 2024]|uniref:Mandelate racemase/muconate lactonizing enzyme N-terminal domain-containing protein n=1 Tax=Pseudooceanicola albus TaxID=2692189 RepID=A0A6L7G1U1_9RHOB|nr:hypothetical protein [Pseudooceanicola albus]MXN17971.1 hypothetical protein [Pseudooceanicola albus]
MGGALILLRRHIDEGLTGIGGAGLAQGKSRKAAAGQLLDFAKLVPGRDPMHVEGIREALSRGTFRRMGGEPVGGSGMSAIDIACRGIRCKPPGARIHRLLGGRINDTLRCCASQLGHGPDPATSFTRTRSIR